MEVTFSGLTRQPSIGKSARNGVDYTSNLLGKLVFLLLLMLTFVSLLVMPLSSSFFYFVPPSISIMTSVLVLLVSSRSCSYWVTVKSLHKLGQISNLNEFFNFIFQSPKILCIVTITTMVSMVFGSNQGLGGSGGGSFMGTSALKASFRIVVRLAIWGVWRSHLGPLGRRQRLYGLCLLSDLCESTQLPPSLLSRFCLTCRISFLNLDISFI